MVRHYRATVLLVDKTIGSEFSGSSPFPFSWPSDFQRKKHQLVVALPGGLGRATTVTVAVRGSGLQTILRSFDKSNKDLFTPVSINSKDAITGLSFMWFFFKDSLVICSPGSCCAWSSPGCLGGNQIY